MGKQLKINVPSSLPGAYSEYDSIRNNTGNALISRKVHELRYFNELNSAESGSLDDMSPPIVRSRLRAAISFVKNIFSRRKTKWADN